MNYDDIHEVVTITDVRYKETSIGKYFDNERTLYLFGDNYVRTGTAGQACIRHAVNSRGIATKRLPSNKPSAFLNDNDIDVYDNVLVNDITSIIDLIRDGSYTRIHIPKDGLGTGLASLKDNAPRSFNLLSTYLKRYFNFDNPGWDGTVI